MGREPRRIAIGIDLIWPYKHHTDIVAGVLAYGRERGWTCELEPFLEKAGVATVPGTAFGAPGHLRLSYAAGMDVLEEAIERMKAAMGS